MGTKTDTVCKNCESQITNDFARVYGDQNNEVHHCIYCLGKGDGGRNLLRHGAGARSDLEQIVVEY